MIIAMWSGPRNISTALMRSFGNRQDTTVTDEPLYGRYLQITGYSHPGKDAIIASQDTDFTQLISFLTGPVPGNRSVWYQKHMAHHLFPDDPLEWTLGMVNGLLIRHPALVIRSYSQKFELTRPEQLGFPQQERLFEFFCSRQGKPPIILDSSDILKAPAGILKTLCGKIGISFDTNMLHWKAGPRATDGVWGKSWYQSVEASTGFQPYREPDYSVDGKYRDILAACLPGYLRIAENKLHPEREETTGFTSG